MARGRGARLWWERRRRIDWAALDLPVMVADGAGRAEVAAAAGCRIESARARMRREPTKR